MIGFFGCTNARTKAPYSDANVTQFKQLLQNHDVQLLDVRTPDEFAAGHIRGAVNINIFDHNFISEIEKELDKSRPVAVYCRSGKRSADAATKLAAKGYKVTNLEGGIIAWADAGLPISH